MKIKSQKDFFSGLMFMGVGVAFAWGATTYNVGNGARMGPGYFPLLLGILLALIGAAVTFFFFLPPPSAFSASCCFCFCADC